jgi:prophage DNA circulation protein
MNGAALSFADQSLDTGQLERKLARLHEEIAAAQTRAEAAKRRITEREAEVRDVLRAELLASQEAVAEMERQHELNVESIRQRTNAEVARILAEARLLATGYAEQSVQPWPGLVNRAE